MRTPVIARALTLLVGCSSGCLEAHHYRGIAPSAPSPLETKLTDLVNRSRVAWKRRPLRTNARLTAVARTHSRRMQVLGQGHHGDLVERVQAAGYDVSRCCENVFVVDGSVREAHDGFLRSKPHVACMAAEWAEEIGVGICDEGAKLYVTEIIARPSAVGGVSDADRGR